MNDLLKNTNLLVAEDDKITLNLLRIHLEKSSFTVTTAGNGEEAWSILQDFPTKFEVIILDRAMPVMDGLEVLKNIKKHETLKNIPVIFLTGKKEMGEILEGLQAGAYYYLTKPYHKETLLTIVKRAVNNYQEYLRLQGKLEKTTDSIKLLQNGTFQFGKLEEGRNLAALLSHLTKDPSRTIIGLWELFVNAVEHGNLGIGYEEKSELRKNGLWYEEIVRRSGLPENRKKNVKVHVASTETEVSYLIEDEGNGFDWPSFIELSMERIFDMHGRGVTLAKNFSFDTLEYLEKGNRVRATVKK